MEANNVRELNSYFIIFDILTFNI